MKLKLLFILVQSILVTIVVCDSEVNQALKLAYDGLNLEEGDSSLLQIVQEAFQKENISTWDELPKTKLEKVKLFLKLPFNEITMELLNQAFDLKQPTLQHSNIVGYGYDILTDTLIRKTPYKMDKFRATPIGYLLPDIYSVTKNEMEVLVQNFKIVESYQDYKIRRLSDLTTYSEIVNPNVFTGTVLSTYNILNLNTTDALKSLKAIQQMQHFKLTLNLRSRLNQEFITDVNQLTPFTQTDRESSNEWRAFFRKYGTHVVTDAFGGGYMQGKAIGDAVINNAGNRDVLTGIKDSIIYFDKLPVNLNYLDVQTFHTFFGGDLNSRIRKSSLNDIPRKDEREKLIQEWKSSVQYDPIVMGFDLKLIPISEIVNFNASVAQEIRNSLNFLFHGELKYKRRRSSTPTPSPQIFEYKAASTTTTPIIRRIPTITPKPVVPDTTNERRTCILPTISPSTVLLEKSTCKKTQRSDYTGNIIGQGYHILQDLILRSSPFALKMISEKMRLANGKMGPIKFPEGATVKTIKDPCSYVLFTVFQNYTEYAEYRFKSINKITSFYFDMDINQFQGSVKPGYNILSHSNENGPFSVYTEIREFTVEADFSKFTLDENFVKAANSLPPYNENLDDCKVHEKWLDFFGKYGTHVVKGGFGGTWTNTRLFGKTKEQIYSQFRSQNGQCNSMSYTYGIMRTYQPEVGILSLTLVKLNRVLSEFPDLFRFNHPLRLEYEMVVMAMLENRFKRCDEGNS